MIFENVKILLMTLIKTDTLKYLKYILIVKFVKGILYTYVYIYYI